MNMKVLRQIKEVAVYEECDYENNNVSVVEFDNEPGFYQHVIKPMLAPGHEGELISWLKSIGLIPQMQRCKNALTNQFCEAPMLWSPSNRMDNYEWKCLGCMQKRTIRDDSIFSNVKCKFKDAIRILLGWSKGNDEELMANILSLRKSVIRGIYGTATATAEKYVRNHLSEFKLGGQGVVVLVDTYPDSNSNIIPQDVFPNARTILCLAEVKNVPTRFWFEALERFSRSSREHIRNTNEFALKVIQEIVLPGSVLVVNLNSTICDYDACIHLTQHYYTVVSTEGISRHDSPYQTLGNNLEVIWRPAAYVCEEAQRYPHGDVQRFLMRQLWRQRFGNESFEMLLNQLCYC